MARIRTVKPDFFRHYELYQAEIRVEMPLRVAFAGLWTAADREGRFKWQPEVLKLDCLPFDVLNFVDVLDALWQEKFIGKYMVDGKAYGYIPSFKKHQVVNQREARSTLPSPSNNKTHVHAHAENAGTDIGPSNAENDENIRKGDEPPKTGEKTPTHMRAHAEKTAENGGSVVQEEGNETERTCTHVHAHGEGKGKEGKERKKDPSGPKKEIQKIGLNDLSVKMFEDFAKDKAPDVNILLEIERFRDYWRSRGKRFKDYPAAFRNWLRKAQEFHDERKGKANSGADPPGEYTDDQGVKRSSFTGSPIEEQAP